MLMREPPVRGRPLWLRCLPVIALLGLPAGAWAQTASRPLTMNDAVLAALKNYPAIKERRARAQAAQDGIAAARTADLPRLERLWQENRATTNNV